MASKNQIEWGEELLDSTHELYLIWWLEELKAAGYVTDHKRPETYNLNDSLVIPIRKPDKRKTTKTLLQGRVYTPDRMILWKDEVKMSYFCQNYVRGKGFQKPDLNQTHHIVFNNLPFHLPHITPRGRFVTFVDVKNPYNKANVKVMFSINQKDMWQRYQIYVNACYIYTLFNSTFTPRRYLKTDSGKGKRSIKNIDVRSLQEYIDIRNKSVPTQQELWDG